jgi:hypothetical protein
MSGIYTWTNPTKMVDDQPCRDVPVGALIGDTSNALVFAAKLHLGVAVTVKRRKPNPAPGVRLGNGIGFYGCK